MLKLIKDEKFTEFPAKNLNLFNLPEWIKKQTRYLKNQARIILEFSDDEIKEYFSL